MFENINKTILLIATFDTKEAEAGYLRKKIESGGLTVLTMDTGILASPRMHVDVDRSQVAAHGNMSLEKALATGDKGICISNMVQGVEALCRELYDQGRFHGIIGIGGGQGTDIGCAAMRSLPTGVPKLMVSTVASGQATFGPFVGTKDITIMHSVADMQGLNFLTRRILDNAAGAICGMVQGIGKKVLTPRGVPVAMSMLGTTTPGALRCKDILEKNGYEVVCFHQNGTGGIAMEDMIRNGDFKGVLDLNLHEIGDRLVGGLHGAIREDRLEAAGEMGFPQVVVPGSINYSVLGPLKDLSSAIKSQKYIVHNSYLTLVRLSHDDLKKVGLAVAKKLNRARGPTRLFIPLRGFSYPDREGLPHWEPEGNQTFIDALLANLNSSIPVLELDEHINDPGFIDPVVETFLSLMKTDPLPEK